MKSEYICDLCGRSIDCGLFSEPLSIKIKGKKRNYSNHNFWWDKLQICGYCKIQIAKASNAKEDEKVLIALSKSEMETIYSALNKNEDTRCSNITIRFRDFIQNIETYPIVSVFRKENTPE